MRLLTLLALGTVIIVKADSAAPWDTVVIGDQTEAEQLATLDLQRYLAQVTGLVPKCIEARAWRAQPVPAVILGTAAGNPVLSQIPMAEQDVGEQGYLLANATLSGQQVIVAVGQTGAGVVHAVYGLLHELGYGFFVGSESVPDALPPKLPSASPRVRKPVFAIRGVLPWYNFFNSPTAWDPIDHRAFIDQLLRGGANFVGFHSYDSEPFAAYEENGTMHWGRRLLNTASPTWGTHPTPTRDYAFGTDRLFADDAFGARTTQGGDEQAAIRREQHILREALDYAHRRGLHTCLGFEINGDPTRPASREVFLKRVNHLLDQYPALDYLWIWQPETQGAQGFSTTYHQHVLRDRLESTSPLELFGLVRRSSFQRIVDCTTGAKPFLQDTVEGKAARANEGARLEQFARLAHRALSHRVRAPKLVISGWGGDTYLCATEYAHGLDTLLPADVAFSCLDTIGCRPRVDAVYGELSSARQRWPIPWLENDGDQWQPQPHVQTFEQMTRHARQTGSQGLLGIHWRTRDIEENLAFLVDYAWQPDLSTHQFFAQLAARSYPPTIAAEMATLHEELDALDYRWVGGGGQTECGEFRWSGSDDGKAVQLAALRERARALLPRAGSGTARLRWLIGVMDWTLAFRQVDLAALDAERLLAASQPGQALERLDDDLMARALATYAGRLSTRGEHGVLATINAKAVWAWRDLRKRCLAALGRSDEPLPPAPADCYPDRIVLPRLIGSVEQAQDLELMPIVLGGKGGWIHYRRLGTTQWTSSTLRNVRGWVFSAAIPAAILTAPGIEYGFSFHDSPQRPMAWGPVAVTVMPALATETRPLERRPVPGTGAFALNVTCETGETMPFALRWNEVPEAAWFRVYRDDQILGDTAVPFFPDAPNRAAAGHRYRVEAWRDGKVLASETVSAKSPDSVREKPTMPVVRWTRKGAWIAWPSATLQVAGYHVERAAPDALETFVPVAELPSARGGLNQIRAELAPGKTVYRISPVNQAGRRWRSSEVALQWPEDQLQEFSLPEAISEANARGSVDITGRCARFTGGGHLELAHAELLNFDGGGTVSFEFQADSLAGMPVMLSHGQWQTDGWFFQILDRRLILRTVCGDLQGPEIQTGKWYALRWENDGLKSDLVIDGQTLCSGQELQVSPCNRTLRVGQYEAPGPQFAFRGSVRNLKIVGWVQRSKGK